MLVREAMSHTIIRCPPLWEKLRPQAMEIVDRMTTIRGHEWPDAAAAARVRSTLDWPTRDEIVEAWRSEQYERRVEATVAALVRDERARLARLDASIEGRVRESLRSWLARTDTNPRWECSPCRSPGVGSMYYNLAPRPPSDPRVTSARAVAIQAHIDTAPPRMLWRVAALIYTLKFLDRDGHADVIDGWISDIGTTDTTNLEVDVWKKRTVPGPDLGPGALSHTYGGPRWSFWVHPPTRPLNYSAGMNRGGAR